MSKTQLIWIIVAVVVVVGGLISVFIFGGDQLSTQVALPDECSVTVNDRDGDCVPDEIDYFPLTSSK